MTKIYSLTPALCEIAKWAFTTRRVNRDDVRGLSGNFRSAKAGDLILCEIVEIGQHKKLQLAERRVSLSYPGDLVVLCLGDRYAPDQFLATAVIDDDLIDLVAGGGVAGRIDAAHDFMDDPTRLKPLGLLTGEKGRVMNVADYALPTLPANDRVTVIGVFGASMNSGKTTAASSLAHGLMRSGYAVAGVKATGTGAFGDFNSFEDGGVGVVLTVVHQTIQIGEHRVQPPQATQGAGLQSLRQLGLQEIADLIRAIQCLRLRQVQLCQQLFVRAFFQLGNFSLGHTGPKHLLFGLNPGTPPGPEITTRTQCTRLRCRAGEA